MKASLFDKSAKSLFDFSFALFYHCFPVVAM